MSRSAAPLSCLVTLLTCTACADLDPERSHSTPAPRDPGRSAVTTAPKDAGRPQDASARADSGPTRNRAPDDAEVASDAELDDPASAPLERFSFFVTSLAGLRKLSNNENGFGGDLRYGERHGLLGADKICSELAESSMPGSARKQWRAFLSAVHGTTGAQVNAIERIGEGPWYDRIGRLVAKTPADLLHDRPQGAHPDIVDDLPNEQGIPNRSPDASGERLDNHHMLTGTDSDGTLHNDTATCDDWSSTSLGAGRPRVGFAWPSDTRRSWLSQMDEAGCLPGINLDQEASPDPNHLSVGSGGGYGGFYCFALTE